MKSLKDQLLTSLAAPAPGTNTNQPKNTSSVLFQVLGNDFHDSARMSWIKSYISFVLSWNDLRPIMVSRIWARSEVAFTVSSIITIANLWSLCWWDIQWSLVQRLTGHLSETRTVSSSTLTPIQAAAMALIFNYPLTWISILPFNNYLLVIYYLNTSIRSAYRILTGKGEAPFESILVYREIPLSFDPHLSFVISSCYLKLCLRLISDPYLSNYWLWSRW